LPLPAASICVVAVVELMDASMVVLAVGCGGENRHRLFLYLE
jgi:hypothetical protein